MAKYVVIHRFNTMDCHIYESLEQLIKEILDDKDGDINDYDVLEVSKEYTLELNGVKLVEKKPKRAYKR